MLDSSRRAGSSQSPLRRRDHAWRLLIAVSFSVVAWISVISHRSAFERSTDVVLGILALALVLVRRRWPVAVAAATVAFAAFSSLAAGPSILAMASLATGRRWHQVLPVGLASVVGGEAFVALNPSTQTDPRWLTAALNIVFTSAVLAWGMYLGSRRELLWSLQRRAQAAEDERDLRAAQSRLEERSRIAREMHDVLAHRISQISVRAGALSYRTDLSREEMRDSAGVIRESAHLALTDLRGVLGVLRDGTGEPRRAPQPTYADLVDLVEEARRTGMRIAYTDSIAATTVPDGVGRTMYRIVQEGLTNAAKHAPGADLGIDVTGAPHVGVSMVVRNALGFARSASPRSGLGLIGLTERAELVGGRLEHAIEGREFVIRVWMPWTT